MVGKQIYIEKRHDRLLKHRARQQGVTESAVIREALDRADADGRAAPGNPAAGQEALSFMRSLARRRRKTAAGRVWTRESLYDERIGR